MGKDNRINKNIIIAVDESENARRAVDYVAQMLGGVEGFLICIMHIISEPEEDFFPDNAEKMKWLNEYKEKIDAMLQDYRKILINEGFNENNVKVRSVLLYCPSMGDCIMAERDKIKYDTIVLGRQGVSRDEEFLFGSVSSKIVNHARNFVVWVVQ